MGAERLDRLQALAGSGEDDLTRASPDLVEGEKERLDACDAYLEEVFLRLRTLEGIPTSWIEPDRAEPFIRSGLLEEDFGSLVPTERGMLLLNELVLALTGE